MSSTPRFLKAAASKKTARRPGCTLNGPVESLYVRASTPTVEANSHLCLEEFTKHVSDTKVVPSYTINIDQESTEEISSLSENSIEESALTYKANLKQKFEKRRAHYARSTKQNPRDTRKIPKVRVMSRVAGSPVLDHQANMFQKVTAKIDKNIKKVQDFKTQLDTIGTVIKSAAYKGSHELDVLENLTSRMEDIIALLLGVYNSANFVGAMSVLMLYCRTFHAGPISLKIYQETEVVIRAMKTEYERRCLDKQATGDDDDSVYAFMNSMKDCIKDWRRHRTGLFAEYAAHFVSILVVLGLAPDWDVNPIKIGQFELFRAKAWNMQKESMNFMDMVVDTCVFFMERGYIAYAKGDISLLFTSETELDAMELEYSVLLAAGSVLDSGRLEDLKSAQIQDEADFQHRYEKLIMRFVAQFKIEKSPIAKNVITSRLVMLRKLEAKFILLQKQSPIRVKPLGISIYGGSAVGKSHVSAVIMKAVLSANKFKCTKDFIVTLNDGDAYSSEFRSHHTGVTMDDFGNTKADKYKISPTNQIIDFLNNVPKAALSAIAENKGNIMIRPKVVCVTTNVESLLAGVFSNEPVSILRRFEFHLTVKLRPDYVDSNGGIDATRIAGRMMPDAWLIDLKKIVIHRTEVGPDDWTFQYILRDASIQQVIDHIVHHSRGHFARQEAFVASTEQLYAQDMCCHNCFPAECDICRLANQARYVFDDDMLHADAAPVEDPEDAEGMSGLERQIRNAQRSIGFDQAYRYEPLHERSLGDIYREHRSTILNGVLIGGVALGTIVALFVTFKKIKQLTTTIEKLEIQRENVLPTFVVTPEDRASGMPVLTPADHSSYWAKPQPMDVPRAESAATTTVDNFVALISKRVSHCTISYPEAKVSASCDIFPLCSNVWVLPKHVMRNETMRITVRQGKPGTLNRCFSELVDSSKFVEVGDDLVLVRLVRGGDNKNFLPHFPTGQWALSGRDFAKIIHKDIEGVTKVSTVKIQQMSTWHTHTGQVTGFCYDYSENTFAGLCMAPVISYASGPCIIGFHLAGKTGTKFGVAQSVFQKEMASALVALNEKCPFSCHSQGTFVTEKFGISFAPSKEIHPDHAVNFLGDDEAGQSPHLEVYGDHGLGRARFKSNVRKSPISDVVGEILELPRSHGPPSNKDTAKHWKRDLDLMSHPKGEFEPAIIDKATRDLIVHVTSHMEGHSDEVALIYPLCKDAVLSGVDGIAAFNRVDLNTSMGFPLNKKKKNFLGPCGRVVPGISEVIDFEDPRFWADVERIENIFASGERCHVVFRGNLKDEPVKWGKDKIRVFAGCEFSFTAVTRKYFLPIVRYIQFFGMDLECAVGINAHGPAWNELANTLTKHGKDQIIAGDYTAFDKAVSPEVMLRAFSVMIEMARVAGYSERDLMIMRGIATEISYPLYELDGVFVQLFGSNPSGHPLTVIINNLVNSLYMRYAYYDIRRGKEDILFSTHIALLCYGDDNGIGVSKLLPEFNMYAIHRSLAKVGVKYTKADKSAITEEDTYESLEDIEFLKRGFYWHADVNAWTAPLDEKSIAKSLHNQMDSKTPREIIASDALSNAAREYFQHGPEMFEKRRAELQEVVDRMEYGSIVGELPSYQDMLDRYHGTTENTPLSKEPQILDSQSCTTSMSKNYEPELHRVTRSRVEKETRSLVTSRKSTFVPLIVFLLGFLCVLETHGLCYLARVSIDTTKADRPNYGVIVRGRKQSTNNEQQNKQQTADEGLCPEHTVLSCQAEESVVYPNNSQTMSQNIRFTDEDAGFAYDLDDYVDPTRMMQDKDDASLGEFLSRPVKIANFEWGLGVTLVFTFNPWTLFYNNPRVSNRLTNYYLMRSKLHVKFLVNGTPFHYGRVIAAYQPLAVFDQASTVSGLIIQDIVQASQMPHIFIDPTASMGGTLELPYFYHKNYWDVPNSDWTDMGNIHLRTINNLQHANGGTDTVTISVFAWATDVSLSIPTSVDTDALTPQSSSGKKKMKTKPRVKNSMTPTEHTEANTKGMISGPATAVAKAAGYLKMIPVLSPYATAAEFAAEKTAAIAKLFGYSRPPVTKDPELYHPVSVSSMALTTVPDFVQKLTIDDQQSLTIDPRIAGVGSEDTMSIKSIASRESYLTTFNWTTSNTLESLLWNVRVNPSLWAESGAGVQKAYHLPACAMAALPFRYWTGSMKFRFQIVKSAYHKGRLKFVYDPSFFQSNEYNTNYLEVVDIAEMEDFTITIGHSQQNTLLEHLSIGFDGVTEGYSNTLYNAPLPTCNGVLGVFVVNRLTAPTSAGANIAVNVFVSMGDDFEVFVPDDSFMNFSFGLPPVGALGLVAPLDTKLDSQAEMSQGPTENVMPYQTSPPLLEGEGLRMGGDLQTEDVVNRVFVGETIASFRPLLKRYNYHTAFGDNSSASATTLIRSPMYPYMRGYVPGAVFTTTSPVFGYNYCNTVLLHWITMAHQGWRGSVRYKMLRRGANPNHWSVSRFPKGSLPWRNTELASPTLVNAKANALASVKFAGTPPVSQSLMGPNGIAYCSATINPNVEFEMPYYSEQRFTPGKRLDYTSSPGQVESYEFKYTRTGSNISGYDIYVAAGEDFQVYFWTGLPRIYFENQAPA